MVKFYYLLNRYLVSTCYLPGTIPDVRILTENKLTKLPDLLKFMLLWKETEKWGRCVMWAKNFEGKASKARKRVWRYACPFMWGSWGGPFWWGDSKQGPQGGEGEAAVWRKSFPGRKAAGTEPEWQVCLACWRNRKSLNEHLRSSFSLRASPCWEEQMKSFM